jgi:hypothetical protein
MQIFNKKISQRGKDIVDRLEYKAIRNNEYGKLKISTIREGMKKPVPLNGYIEYIFFIEIRLIEKPLDITNVWP